jgi:hypothetical protein
VSPLDEIRYINGRKKKGEKLSPYQKWVLRGCPPEGYLKATRSSSKSRAGGRLKKVSARDRANGPCPKTEGSVTTIVRLRAKIGRLKLQLKDLERRLRKALK